MIDTDLGKFAGAIEEITENEQNFMSQSEFAYGCLVHCSDASLQPSQVRVSTIIQ
jgi:hypothetical protein